MSVEIINLVTMAMASFCAGAAVVAPRLTDRRVREIIREERDALEAARRIGDAGYFASRPAREN